MMFPITQKLNLKLVFFIEKEEKSYYGVQA
jgi:hypothetical protein